MTSTLQLQITIFQAWCEHRMTKTVKTAKLKNGGGGGGVGATPKEMARAKNMIVNNQEERARKRGRTAEKMKHSVILDVGGDRFLALRSTLLRWGLRMRNLLTTTLPCPPGTRPPGWAGWWWPPPWRRSCSCATSFCPATRQSSSLTGTPSTSRRSWTCTEQTSSTWSRPAAPSSSRRTSSTGTWTSTASRRAVLSSTFQRYSNDYII